VSPTGSTGLAVTAENRGVRDKRHLFWYGDLMELRETFRAPFLQMAWQRHGRIVDLLAKDESSELRSAASELHCLSGEASMLDFKAVAELARIAEQSAREGNRTHVLSLVEEIRVALKGLEKEGTG
jgi:hypothetical protein